MHVKRWLESPIDNSGLIVFRIFFGFLMAAECFGSILTGWVYETFVNVRFSFNFIGFDFLQHIIGPQAYVIYFLMGVLGICIALGYRYRLSIIGFTLLWAVVYFAQKTHYNNHYYLLLLISFLLWFVPANRYASLDVKQGRVAQQLSVGRWAILIFTLQVGIVYFYAAVAKLYPDWLVGKPLEMWLSNKNYSSFLWSDSFAQQLKVLFSKHSTHLFFAYTGIFFDFLVVPMFLWNNKTRWTALILSLIFHLTNSAIFHIGVFPYFALSFVVFFFKPDDIRKLFLRNKPALHTEAYQSKSQPISLFLVPLFIVYFAIQLMLPLRHFIYPSNVLWTEAGHRLSWRMMLRTRAGFVNYKVITADGKTHTPFLMDYLAGHQLKDGSTKPDLIWRLSREIIKDFEAKGMEVREIYANGEISVNGRPTSQFTDPNFNLVDVPWKTSGVQPWILPEPEGFIDFYKSNQKPKPTD